MAMRMRHILNYSGLQIFTPFAHKVRSYDCPRLPDEPIIIKSYDLTSDFGLSPQIAVYCFSPETDVHYHLEFDTDLLDKLFMPATKASQVLFGRSK